MESSDQGNDLESESFPKTRPKLYQQIIITVLMLAVISVINYFLEKIIQPSSLVFIYLIATIISASLFGTWPAILTSFAGLLVYEFLFTAPKFNFYMYHAQDVYNVTVFFFTAMIIIALIKRVQKQNLIVQFRLDRASMIEEMSRELLLLTPIAQVPEIEAEDSVRANALKVIGNIIIKYTKKIMNVPVFVSLKKKEGQLQVLTKSDPHLDIGKDDLNSARWAFSEGQITGAGISRDMNTRYFFVPLKSHEQIIGVLAIQYDFKQLSEEQQILLRALSNLASMVAERWF